MKKIQSTLIIGAGLVGSALAKRLPDATVWSRARGFDLADEATWPEATGFDVAFFCAALARMNRCESDPSGTAHINVTQTIKLLERLQRNGTHCVFLSTNQVFDGSRPFMEADAPTSPVNAYGRQKVVVETWCQSHPHCAVLRLSKVMAPEMPLFDGWLAGWERGEAVEAFSDMSLAPVWIDDVVTALIQIGQEKQTGIQQISGSEDVSYAEVALRLAPDPSLVRSISYRDKGIPDIHSARYSTYRVTIGNARSIDVVLDLWRSAQKAGKTKENL
jgi:dTDP-4-dehydrorhamnose reductase